MITLKLPLRWSQLDKVYLEKAKNLQVQPEDVVKCIRAILEFLVTEAPTKLAHPPGIMK